MIQISGKWRKWYPVYSLLQVIQVLIELWPQREWISFFSPHGHKAVKRQECNCIPIQNTQINCDPIESKHIKHFALNECLRANNKHPTNSWIPHCAGLIVQCIEQRTTKICMLMESETLCAAMLRFSLHFHRSQRKRKPGQFFDGRSCRKVLAL